jgi:hypothetical protein
MTRAMACHIGTCLTQHKVDELITTGFALFIGEQHTVMLTIHDSTWDLSKTLALGDHAKERKGIKV